ncbi:MAG TPA: LuxR C-terminal-related transcriptional regulator [Rhodocyclaceae bacterium]
MSKPTGHAEIDRQHAILDDLMARFRRICEAEGRKASLSCRGCEGVRVEACRSALASLTDELLTFLVGHVNYEERLMDLLPAVPRCRRHIRLHKDAHADISARIGKLAGRIPEAEPRRIGTQLHRVFSDWMGSHTNEYDLLLADQVDGAELELDGELVAILDELVFVQRPGRPLAADATGARASIIGCLETLTPRQKEVCRLMLGGLTNKDLARELGTTVNTIKTHRAAVFRKMEVASVFELARRLEVLKA